MDERAIGDTLGEAGLAKLVAAFYQGVKNDELLAPLYPEDDWEGAERRLRDFLIFRFGLSNRYIEERGHPRLRMRHAPFAIGVAERDRWIELMGRAMEESKVPESVSGDLMTFLQQVAEFLRNRPTTGNSPG